MLNALLRNHVRILDLREHTVVIRHAWLNPKTKMIRTLAGGRQWPKPDFDPKPYGSYSKAYVACGVHVLPWPEELAEWDEMDEGRKVRITPQYLDLLVRDVDTEAWMRGVGGMSWADRIMHLGAGAALGLILAFFLMRYYTGGVV